MIHAPHYKGAGRMAMFGLGLIMLTEVSIRAISQNPRITTPHSWWLLTGYILAAIYCLVLHWSLKRWELRHGGDPAEMEHSLAAIPVRYWSIVYLLLGLLRVSAPK